MSLPLIILRTVLTYITFDFYRRQYNKTADLNFKKIMHGNEFIEIPWDISSFDKYSESIKYNNNNTNSENISTPQNISFFEYKRKKLYKKLDKQDFELNKTTSKQDRIKLLEKEWNVLYNRYNANSIKPFISLVYVCFIILYIIVLSRPDKTDILFDGIFKKNAKDDKIEFKYFYAIMFLMYFTTGFSVYYKQRVNLITLILPIIIFFLVVYNSKDRLEKLASPINNIIIYPINKITSTIINPIVEVEQLREIDNTVKIQELIYNIIKLLIFSLFTYNLLLFRLPDKDFRNKLFRLPDKNFPNKLLSLRKKVFRNDIRNDKKSLYNLLENSYIYLFIAIFLLFVGYIMYILYQYFNEENYDSNKTQKQNEEKNNDQFNKSMLDILIIVSISTFLSVFIHFLIDYLSQ